MVFDKSLFSHKVLDVHRETIVGKFLIEFVEFRVGVDRFQFELDPMSQMMDLD